MNLSDLWVKMARKENLTPQELDYLKRYGDETQQRNAFIGGNISANGNLNIATPFFLAYNEKLTTAKADITIQIPSGYHHLMVLTSCQTDDAASRSLYAQANSDTGTNYNIQVTSFSTTTLYVNDTSADHFFIGYANSSSAPYLSAAGVAYFNNYDSAWNKTCIATVNAASLTAIGTSSWENSNPINSLRIYAQAGNLVAGSIISVYCIS